METIDRELSRLLHLLGGQHANHGHIDIRLIDQFCDRLHHHASTREVDIRLIKRLLTLQLHVLGDGETTKQMASVKEGSALARLLRAYLT